MTLRTFVVDAFTDRPFAGNPAGVCLLDEPRPDAWMLSVAAEMRHSETAFLLREGAGWRLRWFTPAVEIELCGHATLASAHVLVETGAARSGETIRFATRSGELRAAVRADAIEIDLPVTPVEETSPPPGLAEAVGVAIVRYGASQGRCVAEARTAAEVRHARPDFVRVAALPVWGICLTAASDDARFDFVSRFFAPKKGVDEDPVTGSAHCALIDWWGRRLGKAQMTAHQASARGGVVGLRREGDRAILSGRAVTVLSGEWTG